MTTQRLNPPLPHETLISLPLARRFCHDLPPGDDRLPAAALFLDFLEHHHRAQELEPVCINKPGFPEFDCCYEHRQLTAESRDLMRRAEALLPGTADLPATCGNWWRALGFRRCGGDRTTESTAGMERYHRSTVSITASEAFYGALAEGDDRRPILPVYLDFLRWRQRQQSL